MANYSIKKEQYHRLWDERHPAILCIQSGDTVDIELPEVTGDFFDIHSTVEDLNAFDGNMFYPLAGPIYVEGAEPGDTLAIEILDLKTRGWGWMCILSGAGLLPERFPDPYFRTFDLSNGEYIPFREDIQVPFDPFMGTMGVCPKGARDLSVTCPGKFGGNMDLRHLRKGTTLYLPVELEGAMFSCGDGHAAQGDGEVCVTALEAPLNVSLKFTLIKGKASRFPSFKTPTSVLARNEGAGWYGTTGIGQDLLEGARDAINQMVDYLVENYALDPRDAYLLCSLCVDLKITEVVDGELMVTAMLPLGIFK